MRRLGIVCGVRAEEAALGILLDDDRLSAGVSGASPERAEDIARSLIDDDGCTGLLSFGVSGALSDALKPGDIALARSVVMRDGERIAATRDWVPQLSQDARAYGLTLKHVDMASARDVIADPAAKKSLALETRAHAVDMESGAVARIATDRGVPFAALRAISDGVDHTLPHAALGAVGPGGDIRVAHVLVRLALRPQDLPAMIRLGSGSSKGFASLRRCARHLVPGLLGIV